MLSTGTLIQEGNVTSLPLPGEVKKRWAIASQRFDSGDAKTTLEIFEAIAADGYTEAFAEIGNLHDLGVRGVPQNYPLAAIWYEKAVEAIDDLNAHNRLGRLYLLGKGVNQDHQKALDHFLKAQALDDPKVYCVLGRMYHRGLGTQIDLDRANTFYQKAADKEFVVAMKSLSSLEFQQKRYISALQWRVKTVIAGFRIALKDPEDWRLHGIR